MTRDAFGFTARELRNPVDGAFAFYYSIIQPIITRLGASLNEMPA